MDIEWSDWTDLVPESVRSVPESAALAVYEIRLVDGRGEPIPLRRRVGVDGEGLIYIGASGVLKSGGPMLQRRLTSNRCAHANGKRGAANDEDLNVFWRKVVARHGQDSWLQFRHCVVASRPEAARLEAYLQAQHQARFGEKHDYLWKSQAHPLFPD